MMPCNRVTDGSAAWNNELRSFVQRRLAQLGAAGSNPAHASGAHDHEAADETLIKLGRAAT